MKNKRIVSCAITGSIHVPSLSIYLPLTPEKNRSRSLRCCRGRRRRCPYPRAGS